MIVGLLITPRTKTIARGPKALPAIDAEWHSGDVAYDPSVTSRLIWADIDYHLDFGTRLAASDLAAEAASEVALAHALISTQIGDLPPPFSSELPGPDRLTPDGARQQEARSRAHALALEIQAHYVSEGQHKLADAYESAATWLAEPPFQHQRGCNP